MADSKSSKDIPGSVAKKVAPTLDTLPNEIQQMIYRYAYLSDQSEGETHWLYQTNRQALTSQTGWKLSRVSKGVQGNLLMAVEGYIIERRKISETWSEKVEPRPAVEDEEKWWEYWTTYWKWMVELSTEEKPKIWLRMVRDGHFP